MSIEPAVTVFDLDDTLYPEMEYARSGLVFVGKKLEKNYSCSGIIDTLLECLGGGARHRIFNEILPKFGISLDLIPQLVADYRDHRPDIGLFSDARSAINKAMERGPIALITDGPAICQQQKIAALKLAPLFDLIIVTDEFGREYWKPHPCAYELVMKTFGVEGHQCTYIGDNPTKDFLSANALGWRTIQVKRPEQMYQHHAPEPQYEADQIVKSLKELFS